MDALKEADQSVACVRNKTQMAEMKNQKDDRTGRRSNVFAAEKIKKERLCFKCEKTGHFA
jgi:hypothetical protein